MSQTDPRAVALAEQYVDEFVMAEGIEAITKALADAERRGMERAAKMMCSYCNDPQWPRSAIDKEEGVT